MKKKVLLSLVTIALLGISGCENSKNNASESSVSESSVSNSREKQRITKTSNSNVEEERTDEEVDMEDAQKLLKENTKAEKLTMLFEKGDVVTNGDNAVNFTINGYQYIKIENFSRDFSVSFGDQNREGGVLLVSATYKNNSDKSVYTGPGFSMNVVGYGSAIGRDEDLLENDLVGELLEKNNEIKPNEEISGFVALGVKPAAMQKITESGTAEFELPGFYSKPDSFSKADTIAEPKKERITLSDEGDKNNTESSKFYEDKLTKDNMGTKTMIHEKNLGKSETFENATVTAEGYQITSFEPNEDQASRFSKFESGVVLITVKLNIKNDGESPLNVDSTSATLKIGNTVKMMSENMLQIKSGEDNVGKGSEATKCLVFVLDKDEYEKLYKDQDLLLDVNLYDTDFKRITTIGNIQFELS
ncbi:DUF4352 domain-containing protein [Enterococcus sp.]|uniref:DUF4352 domain-containing protein n=1 Tax=Enterococcus sp. TaxID=35783 RepID=UPI0029097E8C|nr:DUF4352 domain-containing protein [Enterococcus sp.]MDU5334655.1 DUF4352 domain-containing protein [Enterococcus sp.]